MWARAFSSSTTKIFKGSLMIREAAGRGPQAAPNRSLCCIYPSFVTRAVIPDDFWGTLFTGKSQDGTK
jgi:hypothetical protein